MTDLGDRSSDAPDAGAAAPPPPPPPSGGESTSLGDLAAGSDAPPEPPATGSEPTTQLPETEVMAATGAAGMAAAAGGDVPPTDPLDTTFDDPDAEEPIPWYKKPGWIAAMIVVALLIIGGLAWLLFGGDDDDEAATSPTVSRLVLETVDETGTAVEAGFVVSVTGPSGAETSYEWIRPADTEPGEPATESSGSDGRAEFLWDLDSSVEDPASWAATVSFVGQIPPGWTAPGPVIDCIVARLDAQDQTVSLNAAVDVPDITTERVVTYTFPNYSFAPGDSVTCQLDSVRPTVETTVVETTVVETTVVETTEAATTTVETTVPETTVPPTTVPPSTTTTSIDIPPPTPSQTLWDVIEASPSLSEFEQFVIQAGYQPALDNPDLTFTIFAPTNEAIDAFMNGATVDTLPATSSTVAPYDLDELLLAHANNTGVILLADLLNMPSVPVICGGPQPVTAQPPTVGGAGIYTQVPPASNGVLYLIDKVMTPVEPLDPACTTP